MYLSLSSPVHGGSRLRIREPPHRARLWDPSAGGAASSCAGHIVRLAGINPMLRPAGRPPFGSQQRGRVAGRGDLRLQLVRGGREVGVVRGLRNLVEQPREDLRGLYGAGVQAAPVAVAAMMSTVARRMACLHSRKMARLKQAIAPRALATAEATPESSVLAPACTLLALP